MKTNHRMRRGFTLIELLVVIAIIATLAGVGVPMIINKQKEGAKSEAMANAKQIGLAMFTFDQDYGSYPSATTATDVDASNPGSGLSIASPSTANDYFRQLIAAGIFTSEGNFYAKGAYTRKPDNVISGPDALKAGEVGFAYIMAGQNEALSSSSNSGRPLLVASVLNGASDGTFDPDIYAKTAVVFRIDNSARAERIRANDNQCLIGGGKTLMQTGTDTVWGTSTNPVIVPPLKAGGN